MAHAHISIEGRRFDIGNPKLIEGQLSGIKRFSRQTRDPLRRSVAKGAGAFTNLGQGQSNCLSNIFQRAQASSRAFLFASFAFGISPSRMKP